MKKLVTRPQALLVLGFLSAILVGSILLSLPFAHHGQIPYTDALFTSVSAVCVTGLITMDTGKDFTLAGQWIILLMIQLGGLGIMSFSAMLGVLLGHKMSLKNQYILSDVFLPSHAARTFGQVLLFTFAVTLGLELLGALLIWQQLGGETPFFVALFHSISAFCNAGFSLWSDSLCRFRGAMGVNTIMMALIILGGLGHVVLFELFRRGVIWRRGAHPVNFSLHTRVVLWSSLALVVLGTALFMFLERNNTLADLSGGEGFLASLFQSVTTRTAGFNTIDCNQLRTPTLFLLTGFMLIGGSPGSTAGGIKTTTMLIALTVLWSSIRDRNKIRLLQREVPAVAGKRALVILAMVIFLFCLGTIFLSAIEGASKPHGPDQTSFIALLFEAASALGTVGLSTGITPGLAAASKVIIMILMFVGRLGPITLATFAVGASQGPQVGYPEENVMLG